MLSYIQPFPNKKEVAHWNVVMYCLSIGEERGRGGATKGMTSIPSWVHGFVSFS